jgi:hypothetical protein
MENDTRELEREGDLSLEDEDEAKPAATTYALEERACIARMLGRPPPVTCTSSALWSSDAS